MDKNSNVGTQYIICECGDNFPDENLLNIHLANDHGSVEVYQCNAVSICNLLPFHDTSLFARFIYYSSLFTIIRLILSYFVHVPALHS